MNLVTYDLIDLIGTYLNTVNTPYTSLPMQGMVVLQYLHSHL